MSSLECDRLKQRAFEALGTLMDKRQTHRLCRNGACIDAVYTETETVQDCDPQVEQ